MHKDDKYGLGFFLVAVATLAVIVGLVALTGCSGSIDLQEQRAGIEALAPCNPCQPETVP